VEALYAPGRPKSISIKNYELRHTCATLLLKAKGNLKVVTERVGHASVSLTFDVYSHVLPDMQQTVNEKLETLLFRKTGTQNRRTK
jgi:integrase